MSIPYFPMYPDDFEADTAHLTLAEDGAYNRLLRLCWRTPGCKVPADEAWLFRKLRAHSPSEQDIIRVILQEYFVRKAGKFFNPRLLEEYAKAHDKHERRVLAGSKGGKAKALKNNKTGPSNALAKAKQPEPEPEPSKKEAKASQKRGTRLPENWVLPKAYGEWAISQGWSEPVIRLEAEKFRDYWVGVPGQRGLKLDWLATWRNHMRRNHPMKVINGGHHDAPSKADRLQRTIAAAAAGTSREDWG